MASFKEVRDLLLLEHSNGLISDDELLFFMGEYQSKNPEFTYDIYERFNLDDMEEPECKAYFRFEKNDIPVLAETLGLPDFFKCTQRTVAGLVVIRNPAPQFPYSCLYFLCPSPVGEVTIGGVLYFLEGLFLKFHSLAREIKNTGTQMDIMLDTNFNHRNRIRIRITVETLVFR
ncbi:predicted protein [Nematostella vectensis]|uniref:Uncharacterized protein n=1 Tax=Nematostella vectensis TaxID=45351 RepID=A7SG50_NEMVE|nr:predicted protein [Nematostella vectensis]|eukprot:XP_001629383.1 predicted protein [Nematostella vectensis]